jgi:glutamyl-tRNA reductase
MALKFEPGESYDSWASRVEKFELEQARKRIAKGDNPELVLEAMSKSMTQKLMHPILQVIRDSAGGDFDPEANRKSYNESIKGRGVVADHVERDT